MQCSHRLGDPVPRAGGSSPPPSRTLSLLPTAPPPPRSDVVPLSPAPRPDRWVTRPHPSDQPWTLSWRLSLARGVFLKQHCPALGWRTVPPPSALRSGSGQLQPPLTPLTPQPPTHPAPAQLRLCPGQPGSNQSGGNACQQSPCVPLGRA